MRIINHFREIFTYVNRLRDIGFVDVEYQPVYEKLSDLFDNVRQIFEKMAYEKEFELCLFAVCAWIDELVLVSDWPSKEIWRHHLLQQEYFRTSDAGELFYDRLDELTANQGEVAEVYYYCLAFGFTGRFYHSYDHAILSEKQQKAYKKSILSYQGESLEEVDTRDLCPEVRMVFDAQKSNHTTRRRFTRMGIVMALLPIFPTLLLGLVFYSVFQDTVFDYINFLR